MERTHKVAPAAPRSNGWMSRVIGPATAKFEGFAITVNGRDTIGVIVDVDRECGAPEWMAVRRALRVPRLLPREIRGSGRRNSCEMINSDGKAGKTLWSIK